MIGKLLGLTVEKTAATVCSSDAKVNLVDTDISMQVWLCEKACLFFYEVVL